MAWNYNIGVGKYLTVQEQKENATEVLNYFSDKGLTFESICGILGNMQQESTMNPGAKQNNSSSGGWGLIQWSPNRVLTGWASSNRYSWFDGSVQCERIWLEATDPILSLQQYWKPTSDYPYTWEEFMALTDVEEATKAFLYERERASSTHEQDRIAYAIYWQSELQGVTPIEPIPPKRIKKGNMPIYMYIRRL